MKFGAFSFLASMCTLQILGTADGFVVTPLKLSSPTALLLRPDQTIAGGKGSGFAFQDAFESSMKLAYKEWKAEHGKNVDEWDETRYRIFKTNYVVSKRAYDKDVAKAKMAGKPHPAPMRLNEYADWTREEYMEKFPMADESQ